MPSPRLNVTLVIAEATLFGGRAAEASVFDLGLGQSHCQVGLIASQRVIFLPAARHSGVNMHTEPRR